MNNLSTVAIGVIIVVALLLLVLASKGKKGTGHTEKPYANKTPVSKNEQAMYWQLCKALPEYLVMCQMSFGALLRASAFVPEQVVFLEKTSDDDWEKFIRRVSSFATWSAMLRDARGEWIMRRLGVCTAAYPSCSVAPTVL